MESYGILQIVNSVNVNPMKTLWIPPQPTAYTNSSSVIASQPLHPENNNPCAAIGRQGDLLKTIWYKIVLDSPLPDNPYDIIEDIEYIIGGAIIEKYSGTSLEIISQYDPKAKCSISGNTIVFPLLLSTSGELALPLICLAFHEVKIDIKLSRNIKIKSHSFEIAYVYLDFEERRRLCHNNLPHEYNITQKFSIKKQATCYAAGQTIKIPIKINHMRNKIRDIAFKITPLTKSAVIPYIDHDGLTENPKDAFMLMLLERIDMLESKLQNKHDPLVSATFVFNASTNPYTIRHKQDAVMLRSVIPREYYGFTNEDNTYYMPFDHTATQLYSSSSLSISLIVLELELELLPGLYDIDVLVRHNNVLRISSGMGGLQYPSLDS
jgi:hypothetical protein